MASGRGASSRWFFTREQLENTPSRRCGMEADKELSYRQQAANLIQEMGQRLNVYPFLCLALRRSRPVPLTTRPVAGPGVPRTWRCCLGLRWVSAALSGKVGSGSESRERPALEERSPGMQAALCNVWGCAWSAAGAGGWGWKS